MHHTDPLIRTKLRLPFIRPGLVPRPLLQARIAEGLQYPLTLVIAPAGFGKTTLVAASLAGSHPSVGHLPVGHRQEDRMPVAWLSLDRDDNQGGRFLVYLIAAIQGADSRIGSQAIQLFTGMKPPTPEAVLTSLINDLDTAAAEMVLVLDDYQFISSPEVHAGVAFLLDHCPPAFHLLIATRSDPPLPLARLRARGQMTELRTADLRFTGSEAAQFLNGVMGLDLDSAAVTVLEERTEGWVAGLQMAALSLRERGDVPGFIAGFSGTNRHILDYLLEEILAGQTPEVQQFLLQTSILERMCAPLCEAVMESREWRVENSDDSRRFEEADLSTPHSQDVLESLDRCNLFLVPLDEERIWFRYHHLFADLLKVRLCQTQPDRVPELHRRASAWLEQNELIPEAIQHLFAARDMDRAAELIERYGPVRLAESDSSVFQLADSLPHERILARPKIGLYQAWLFIIEGEIGKALPLLNDLRQHLAGRDAPSAEPWIQTVVDSALAFLGRPAVARGSAPLPAAPLPAAPLPEYALLEEIPAGEPILRNVADYLYGMALARRGELDRAAEVAVGCIQRETERSAALPHGTASRGTPVIPTLAPFLSRVYLMQGRLHAAAALCREFLDPLKEKGIRFIYTSGSMKIDLGEVLYEWNCLEEAEQHIRDGLQTNEPWKNIMTDGFGYSALARVLQAKGDPAGALQTVERFETRLLEHSMPREFDEDLRTLRVRLQLGSGDVQAAADWADQVLLSEDFRLHEAYYRLTLARIRLAQGRHAEVEKWLAGMAPTAWAGSLITRQLESNLLLAAAAAGQDRLPEAFGWIEACLALAEPEGYIHVFLDAGETARDLLAAYLRTEAPGHTLYAQKILEAFSLSRGTGSPESPSGGRPAGGPSGRSAGRPSGLVEPLSERELEVLQLIALGRTNPEIARQLVVSPGTVKAHSASIYRKLDVANRTEAVARARQLGILL